MEVTTPSLTLVFRDLECTRQARTFRGKICEVETERRTEKHTSIKALSVGVSCLYAQEQAYRLRHNAAAC